MVDLTQIICIYSVDFHQVILHFEITQPNTNLLVPVEAFVRPIYVNCLVIVHCQAAIDRRYLAMLCQTATERLVACSLAVLLTF